MSCSDGTSHGGCGIWGIFQENKEYDWGIISRLIIQGLSQT
jgi:hypothetical protein